MVKVAEVPGVDGHGRRRGDERCLFDARNDQFYGRASGEGRLVQRDRPVALCPVQRMSGFTVMPVTPGAKGR